jgi:hypothetical protein
LTRQKCSLAFGRPPFHGHVIMILIFLHQQWDEKYDLAVIPSDAKSHDKPQTTV